MNYIVKKRIDKEAPESILVDALKLYDQGKSVSDILALYPDQKEELSRTFEAVNVLKKQKELINAPKELLVRIVSDISMKNLGNTEKKNVIAPSVTSAEDNRYLLEDDRSKILTLESYFSLKKMYAGVIALLLISVVAGISYWQSHRGGNDVAVNLPIIEVNKLTEDQEALGKDITDFEEAAFDYESLDNIDQDLADISSEQISNKESSIINKTVDVAYLEKMETDFGLEIASFSNDSQDLEGISSDMSLSVLDNELSGI